MLLYHISMGIVAMRSLSYGCEFASGTRIGGLKFRFPVNEAVR